MMTACQNSVKQHQKLLKLTTMTNIGMGNSNMTTISTFDIIFINYS